MSTNDFFSVGNLYSNLSRLPFAGTVSKLANTPRMAANKLLEYVPKLESLPLPESAVKTVKGLFVQKESPRASPSWSAPSGSLQNTPPSRHQASVSADGVYSSKGSRAARKLFDQSRPNSVYMPSPTATNISEAEPSPTPNATLASKKRKADTLLSKLSSKAAYVAVWSAGKAIHLASNLTESVVSYLEPAAVKYIPMATQNVSRIPGAKYLLKRARSLSQSNSKGTQAEDKKAKTSHPEHLYQYRDAVFEFASSVALKLPFASKVSSWLDPASFGSYLGITPASLQKYRVYPGGTQKPRLSFSFSGCFWLVPYELGVAQCIKDYIKPWILDDCYYAGSSTGSAVASCLVLDVNLQDVLQEFTDIAVQGSKRMFGPAGCMNDTWRAILEKHLPIDIHKAQESLFISTTHFPSFSNSLESKFADRTDLIDHIVASNYIPLYYENPATIKGQLHLDGSLTRNIPVLDDYTVTVSPIPGKATISPRVSYSNARTFFPSSDPEYYQGMYQDGYRDAHKWMKDSVTNGQLTSLLFRRRVVM